MKGCSVTGVGGAFACIWTSAQINSASQWSRNTELFHYCYPGILSKKECFLFSPFLMVLSTSCVRMLILSTLFKVLNRVALLESFSCSSIDQICITNDNVCVCMCVIQVSFTSPAFLFDTSKQTAAGTPPHVSRQWVLLASAHPLCVSEQMLPLTNRHH